MQVYSLNASGMRDEGVHAIDAVIHQQAQPVPHGFLAKSLCVQGPYNLVHMLPNIHSGHKAAC